jgi:hypothetical protein
MAKCNMQMAPRAADFNNRSLIFVSVRNVHFLMVFAVVRDPCFAGSEGLSHGLSGLNYCREFCLQSTGELDESSILFIKRVKKFFTVRFIYCSLTDLEITGGTSIDLEQAIYGVVADNVGIPGRMLR